MSKPIDMLFDGVEWQSYEGQAYEKSDLPHATHYGVLTIADVKLRCYRLSTGECVFDADDVLAFFGELGDFAEAAE